MRHKVVFGVDPDSERHGVAMFRDGLLVALKMLSTVELITGLASETAKPVVSIENVMANQFVYRRNEKASKSAQSKVAMHVGRCQQAQMELMRWLDHHQIPYVLHRPQKGNWANNRPLFEKATGWSGRSNSDTRAAAYFGYLEIAKS